jgi:5-methylcytosine-specific restriction endonuclease McrA
MYCSDGCKSECPIYNQSKWPKGFKKATSREVQPQLRQMVLERDNYECQKCGSELALHCHHIYPLNESPITSADMDECITLCLTCHEEVHMNVAGCGYYEMRCSIK